MPWDAELDAALCFALIARCCVVRDEFLPEAAAPRDALLLQKVTPIAATKN